MTGRDDIPATQVEAACKGYWPTHWPHQFDEKDADSIRAHMRNALAAALALRPSADHEAVRQRAVEECAQIVEARDKNLAEWQRVAYAARRDRAGEIAYERRQELACCAADIRAALRKPANEIGGGDAS